LTLTATSDDAAELLPGYYIDPWNDTGAWCTLPWPLDMEAKLRLLENSIGPQIIDWAEWRTYEETGEPGLIHHLTGERWRFTDGQKRFIILWYAYDPETGRWLYRNGIKRGAKGTGKDPFGAAMCNIELIGPCKLVKRDGLWIGEQRRMALVQVASNSEAQSKDVLAVANGQLCRETREYYGIDCGITRTNVAGGSRFEILTASEKTAEGDPATFIMVNESHHMTESSGGHRIAEVVRRNVAKSPKDNKARTIEFTNAHLQGYDSAAERAFIAWQTQVVAGRVDILYDSIEAPPSIDITDEQSRMAGLKAAYMDAPWGDLEGLSAEMLDSRTSVADSIRYYLNGLGGAQDAWVDPRKLDEAGIRGVEIVVADKEQIAMFLDCSKSTDATGLVASRISDGHVFTLGMWQRPHGDRGKGWLAPRDEVDAVVRATMKRYHVVWFGVDPSPAKDDETEALYWLPQIDEWHRDFRDKLPIWATSGEKLGHSVLFDMRLSQRGGLERNKLFTEAAMQTVKDIEGDENQPGTLTFDGDARLRLHAHNARRRPNQWGVSLGKITRDSSKLVDLAVCMVGARMGRRIALNSGKLPKKRSGRAVGWG
jgi:hypothetical protein